MLLRAPLQRGATAVFVSFSLPSVKQNYGVRATGQQCTEAGDICAICQAEFREPLVLMCQVSRAGRDHWRRGPRGHRTTGLTRWVFPGGPGGYGSRACCCEGTSQAASVQVWVFTLPGVLLPREQKLVGWGEQGWGGGGSVAGLCRSWALNTGLGHPGLPSVRPTLNQTFRGCPSI